MRSVACVLCTISTLLFFVSAAPAAQAASSRFDRGERGIVRAINRARHHEGLPKLRMTKRLARAADVHSRNMLRADYFAHGAFVQRVRHFASFRRVGETLAMSTRCSSRRFVQMWLHSAPHRRVLLSRRYRRVGVGRRVGRLGSRVACLVTADFASRR